MIYLAIVLSNLENFWQFFAAMAGAVEAKLHGCELMYKMIGKPYVPML